MRKIHLIIPFSILILSCEKNQNDSNNDNIKDNIYFYDINPDIVITATEKYYNPGTYHSCSETPIPTDSIARYSIDLNNDIVPDFEFNVKRWKYIGVGSSFQFQPCLRYQNFRTTISSLNDSNKICTKSGTPLANEYLFGDIISNDSTWSNNIWALYTQSVENQNYYAPENMEYYLGVKIFKENKYYYGWLLLNLSEDTLILKKYAVNLSENLEIKAGQEK